MTPVRSKRHNAFEKKGNKLFLLVALFAMLFQTEVRAQGPLPEVNKLVTKSNSESTKSEGLLLEASPTYIDFIGQNGLKLAISLPQK